jgi:branched-chain amino acid transport system permease protein
MDLTAFLAYGIYLLSYFFIYSILALGLNVQFGYTGIPNFTYITFVALGAYITGATGLPRPGIDTGVHYILGFSWPFPLTLIAGGIAAAGLGLLIGFVGLRRLQGHYLAITTFGFGFIGYDLIANYKGIFNGEDGLAGIQPPLNNFLQLDYATYPFFFAALSGLIALAVWLVAQGVFNSGLGRVLRAIRQDPEAAEALGKDTFRFQLVAIGLGCAMAGIGGGLLIELVSAGNPAAWLPPETFVVYAALLIGGKGNNIGAMLGSFLVPVLFLEGTRFLPVPSAYVVQFSALRLIVVGILLLLVLWFRPQGVLPEPKRVFSKL